MAQPMAEKKRSSGSDKRQLTGTISVRCTAAQKEEAARKAAERGMTVSELFFHLILGKNPARRRRRGVDTAELTRLLGQLNYVGNNLNQQVRLAHLGEPVPITESHETLRDVQNVARKVLDLLETGT